MDETVNGMIVVNGGLGLLVIRTFDDIRIDIVVDNYKKYFVATGAVNPLLNRLRQLFIDRSGGLP